MKIIIADSNDIVRESITRLIEKNDTMSVAGYAVNGIDAVFKSKSAVPDGILIDSSLPVLNGIEAARLIRHAVPSVKIIIMSINRKEEYIYKSFSAGATGFVFKLSPSIEILEALKATAQNRYYISPGLKKRSISSFINREKKVKAYNGYELFTMREEQVFRLLVEGTSLNSIAEMLSLDRGNVETCKSSICRKINLYDMDSMVHFAESIGIIDRTCNYYNTSIAS